ncbi:MAG TPA: hypothetical protein VHO48_09870 [Anaerolineaceae bacterium]|nr:hypothetical protein [Anaerolineaceae bacterium]
MDPHYLMTITDIYGSIDKKQAKAAGYVIEAGDAWNCKDADVLIPAALEAQINAQTVGKISPRVKLIAEGANGPSTPEADEVFKHRGVFLIPDFLCRAGGVTVSYFESVQSDMNFFWTKEEVLQRLDTKMTQAFAGVLELATQKRIPMRDAAQMIAIQRVVKAMELRGWI